MYVESIIEVKILQSCRSSRSNVTQSENDARDERFRAPKIHIFVEYVETKYFFL